MHVMFYFHIGHGFESEHRYFSASALFLQAEITVVVLTERFSSLHAALSSYSYPQGKANRRTSVLVVVLRSRDGTRAEMGQQTNL